MSKFRDPSAEETVRQAIQIRDRHNEARRSALLVLTELTTDNLEHLAWILGEASELESKSCSSFRLEQITAWLPYLAEMGGVLSDFLKQVETLSKIGVGTVRSVAEIRRMIPVITVCASAPSDSARGLVAALAYPGALEALREARIEAETLKEAREQLKGEFAMGDIPDVEHLKEIKTTLRATGGKILSFLNADYRKSKKAVLRFLKTPKSYKFPSVVDRLEKLQRWIEAEVAFRENAHHKKALGERFIGLDTGWESLIQICKWSQEMASLSFSFETTARIAEGDTQTQIRRTLEEMTVALRRYDSALEKCRLFITALLGIDDPDAPSLDEATAYINGCDQWLKGTLQKLREQVRSTQFTIQEIRDAALSASEGVNLKKELDDNAAFNTTFSPAARGLESDWDSIEKSLLCYQNAKESPLTKEILEWILDQNAQERTQALVSSLDEAVKIHAAIEAVMENLSHFGETDPDWLFDGNRSVWRTIPPRFEQLREHYGILPQWVIYQKLAAEAESLGVKLFAEEAFKRSFPVERMPDVYEHTVCESHGFKQMAKNRSLSTFTHLSHETARVRFARRDKKLLTLNQQEVAARASNRRVPYGVSRGAAGDLTERALLEREMGKTRRHIPIRELMLRAGTAIRALKPCVMMSPLSVANFLDPYLDPFDLIVMDEASQIRPEDALGAIARGKQLVVVGDTKQMPPSSFYQTVLSDDEDEDAEISAADESESILECSLHAFSPVYRLKWHYRSQHENLIKFSNHHYYDNDLIIFPSAGRSKAKLGVFFNYVDDATLVKRRNDKEAQMVARAAIKHLVENPSESLLVATMNLPQQELIESWIDRWTEHDGVARQAVEEARARESEEFSVKNLENIQGHQRDVVFISMTYAKDPESGRVLQRFGPLNGKDGRRRLNVLFTRAKLRMEVFSSMTFQDITSSPGNESGVNDLRNYLRFAQEGVLYEEGIDTGRPPDSEFEEAVTNVIRSVGLVPSPQVGVASFRIDIGVSRPDRPGEFILGVECDGATYHSSRSARDRDRLREEVLVSRGWKIYRVWSTDWFYQHAEAKKRLIEALQEAAKSS